MATFTRITESALYLQDYFDFLAIVPTIRDEANAIEAPKMIKEGIRFDNVGFKYPGTEIWAVRHVSFLLYPGEKLALVGENGAGKTTLVKLLARMYDPSEGMITIDGQDIRSMKIESYRKMIGVDLPGLCALQLQGRRKCRGRPDRRSREYRPDQNGCRKKSCRPCDSKASRRV